MKKWLGSTAALSLALANVQPWPLLAQTLTEDGSVVAVDGSVLCAPSGDAACNPADFADAAKAIEDKIAAEKAAADQAAADQAAADQAAAEKAAADQAAADQAAAEKAAADQAAADQAAAEKAAADQAAADQAAAEKAAADQAAADQAAAEKAAADQAATDQATTEAPQTEVVKDKATGMLVAAPTEEAAAPVEAPVPGKAEVETLSTLLGTAEPVAEPAAGDAAAATAAPVVSDAAKLVEDSKPAADGKSLLEAAPAKDAVVTTEVMTDKSSRSSGEEFTAAPTQLKDGKKSGLSDLEKVGLVALGALAVGAIINEGKKDQRKVVSNTGDRVVVENPDGSYQVYKDDDAVIRRPGSTVRTESFKDGSTRTIIERKDGTQVVTIRDASGRVLRRAQYDKQGRELVLIDDLEPEEVVVLRDLPKPPKKRLVISSQDENAALTAALAATQAEKIGRSFSLRQIRDIPQVRQLAATIDVDNITFDSGSAAIKAAMAQNLADLGRLMQDMLDKNPAEMFLIEGHTDAVGSASSNLALSDRRAESVALALTEYFDVPPENMVVQGYGESELRIDTQADERANRRVAVRIISPLMGKIR